MFRRFFKFIKSLFIKEIKIVYIRSNSWKITRHGNCFDIPLQEDFFPPVRTKIVYPPLGIRIQLPKYYRGVLFFRSSTPKRYAVSNPGGWGEMEWNYAGEWHGQIKVSKRTPIISKGSRLFQFYIEPIWDAPWYVKLSHIFSKFELVEVQELDTNRKGLGSSGI